MGVDAQLLYSGNNKRWVGCFVVVAIAVGRSVTTTSWMLAMLEEDAGFCFRCCQSLVRSAWNSEFRLPCGFGVFFV